MEDLDSTKDTGHGEIILAGGLTEHRLPYILGPVLALPICFLFHNIDNELPLPQESDPILHISSPLQ